LDIRNYIPVESTLRETVCAMLWHLNMKKSVFLFYKSAPRPITICTINFSNKDFALILYNLSWRKTLIVHAINKAGEFTEFAQRHVPSAKLCHSFSVSIA